MLLSFETLIRHYIKIIYLRRVLIIHSICSSVGIIVETASPIFFFLFSTKIFIPFFMNQFELFCVTNLKLENSIICVNRY